MTGRGRLAAWSLLLVLGTGATIYFALSPAGDHDHDAAQGTERWLVPFPMEDLTGLAVVHSAGVRHFLRDEVRRWYAHDRGHDHGEGTPQHDDGHAHVADPALSQRIEEAFEMFGQTRIERVVASGQDAARFGTSDPEMVIMLYRAGNALPFRRILVGDVAPDSLARYVLLQEEGTTVTIPNYQIENLTGLLATLDGADP